MHRAKIAVLILTGLFLTACERETANTQEKDKSTPSTRSTQQPQSGVDAEQSKPAPSAPGSGGHSGEVIPLGETTILGMNVRASRDKGEISPGGDAPVDVWIDGGIGTGVSAVRFWIGTQDAKGSRKARAEIEDGKWHTHAEVPDSLNEEPRLWVEIESSDGTKSMGSFHLQR